MTHNAAGILGVSGRIRGGKDTAVDWFVEKCDAVKTSYGDMLARALKAMEIAATRRNLQTLSTLLRIPVGPQQIYLDEGGFLEQITPSVIAGPGLEVMRRKHLDGALNALHIELSEENLNRFEELILLDSQAGSPLLHYGGFGEDILAKGIFIESQELKKTHGRVVLGGIRRFADSDLFRAREPSFKSLAIVASLETRWKRAINDPSKPDEAKMTLEEYGLRDNAETEREVDAVSAIADFTIVNEGTKEEFYARLREVAAALGWPIGP